MSKTPKPKAPRESWVEMTELVLPQHTNARGTAFGGTVVSWVDIAASVCAMRHCQKPCVTASIDAMHFLAPVKLGWILHIKASVNFTGRTSLEIGVRVDAENPLTGDKYHTASAYVTMVALDDHNKPATVTPILLETDDEKKRHEDAVERRQFRLNLRDSVQKRRGKK